MPNKIMDRLVEIENQFRIAHKLGGFPAPQFQMAMMLIEAFKLTASELENAHGRIDDLERIVGSESREA